MASTEGDEIGGNGSTRTFSRRKLLQTGTVGVATTGLAGCLSDLTGGTGTFKIGVALPFSQGWEPFGTPILNAIKIGRQRIADDGGLNGEEVELVVEDTQADPGTAAERTEKLITQDDADIIIGPVTSASRNAMAPVLQENETPCLYTIDYEGPAGQDYCNEYLFKFGEVPIQQIDPLVPWLMDNYGDSFYLIGTDYIWPQTQNKLIRGIVENRGGSILGETYVPFGTSDFSSILSNIESEDPDVLFMTLTGATAINMSTEMANQGLRENWKEVGLAHVQTLVNALPREAIEGLLNCRDYFRTLDNSVNDEFLADYTSEFGEDSTITTHAGLGFMAMQMLKKGVEDEGGTSTEAVMAGLSEVTVDSPMGQRSIVHDHQANHACTVAEVSAEKQWEPVTKFDQVMPEETCSSF